MENVFREYSERKFRDLESRQAAGNGPIVTISREFGCPSKPIAQMLTDTLNKGYGTGKKTKWRFINKEIVEESARELELKPVEMNYLLSSGEKGLLEDMLTSFSPTYVSNIKIKKTITRVVLDFAKQGTIILVGRGAAAILQGYPKTLHIRLQAPLSWRIPEIKKLKNVDDKTAKKMAMEIDQKRTALIEFLLGQKFDQTLFDIIFNCSTISKEEMIQGIIRLMEVRGMV